MFKLDRLTIRTFRDVVPGTTLEFGPRFNVLLGVNATGKSTLLDLIAAICADDLSTYRQEALDIEYVVSSVAAEDVPLSISCSTRWNADEPRSPRADLTLTMKDEPTRIAVSGRAAVCNETQFVLSAAPDEVLFRLSLITSAMSAQQAIGNRAWLLFNAAPIFRPSPVGVRRFDESLRYFDSVRTRWRRKTPAPAPPSIAKRIAEELPEDGSTPYKLVQVNGVDWFDELLLLLGFKSAQLSIAAPEPGALEIRDFVFLTLNGRACGPESLSYGQKRLLAFEWYRHSGGQLLPVVADELSNGLHHAWIIHCMRSLEARQSFLTSQGTLVLDALPWSSVDEVRNMFVRCERADDRFVWRNLTLEEATEIYESREVGIEKTSAILAREGLW